MSEKPILVKLITFLGTTERIVESLFIKSMNTIDISILWKMYFRNVIGIKGNYNIFKIETMARIFRMISNG